MEEARRVFTLLDIFANYSGLPINQEKSTFVDIGMLIDEEV